MTDSPELRERVAIWVKEAAKCCGTQAKLAEKSELTLRSVQTYISGSSTPGGIALISIAKASGQSLDALVWPERANNSLSPAPIADGAIPAEYVFRAAKELEEWLVEENGTMDNIDKKMEVLKLWAEELYKEAIADGTLDDPRPDHVTRPAWLKVVASN